MIGWLKLKPRESIGAMADHSTVIWMAEDAINKVDAIRTDQERGHW